MIDVLSWWWWDYLIVPLSVPVRILCFSFSSLVVFWTRFFSRLFLQNRLELLKIPPYRDPTHGIVPDGSSKKSMFILPSLPNTLKSYSQEKNKRG